MKPPKRTLRAFITIASVLSLFLLLSGFMLAVQEVIRPNKSPATAKAKPKLASIQAGGMLVGLGDSLTRGVGDSSGQGYFGIVKKNLQKEAGSSFSAINLAISGQTSSQLVNQVKQSRVKEIVKSADWITITIGGNDLFRSSGRFEKIDEQAAEKGRLAYEQNLTVILKELRNQNREAVIFLFGLYNPFGDLPDEEKSSRLVGEWNETMQEVSGRFQRVVVIPTFDLFQLKPKEYLYSDHFHPNQQGYERMAERLLQVIRDSGEGKATDAD
ncbi:SGNH/GDSL hydrolase family protein [Lihuaxuella thermophila]|uniref:Lysophospholipase L1 n=1 Tax=Lihuaxuella thermophila TaxID=1173111 RepID=A0A1H8FUB3_9BACL|nr:SGNH/GDSL hydrolase family protein [Lihuaxuella thermophila]SEN34847.1 Lysophospholipase L1 [Lihuaxuella thermophila]